MTSSLVGSEMCIRDRPWSLLRQQPVPLHRSREDYRCTEAARNIAQPHHCLLYTSDAADDM
eukprot:6741465-Prorocentrum_lima.AAC.1